MGSDRQSILVHENGKKHIENQEKAMQKKRSEREQQEKKQQTLMASIQQMEKVASVKHSQDYGFGLSSSTTSFNPPQPIACQSAQTPSAPTSHPSKTAVKEEKEKWLKRKKEREDAKTGLEDSQSSSDHPKRRKLLPDEGHYEYDGKIYLEGPVFGDLLEEDMPVQIWTGSHLASLREKRLPERDLLWKNAIVAATRQGTAHIAYLADPTDADETVEKNVPLDRIRIILGADDAIPDTLEEARIMVTGGEHVIVEGSEKLEVDEATGLTGWSAVTIKRTTVRQEVKEERARLREKRKEETKEKEAKEKEGQARRLEELKFANADDSALGSVYFAELGHEVQGYKGVDISAAGDESLTVEDTVARSLSSGKASVGFRRMKKNTFKNPSRRTTTSADDD
jgi:WW domain-binding protein 4